MQLRRSQSCECLRFIRGDGSAVDGAQEIIQEPLAGRGIVEDFSDKGSLSGFRDEITKALRCSVEALQEERIDRSVTCDELRRMKIPALIVAIHKRMLNVIEMQLPCM